MCDCLCTACYFLIFVYPFPKLTSNASMLCPTYFLVKFWKPLISILLPNTELARHDCKHVGLSDSSYYLIMQSSQLFILLPSIFMDVV